MKTPLLTLALMAASATLATADGLMLRWQDCSGDGGVQNRTFACNSNTGSNVLVGSFVFNGGLANVEGVEFDLVFSSASSPLPEWWRFKNVGSCRQTALTMAAHDGLGCPDMFALQSFMAIATYGVGDYGPNTAHLEAVSAVPSAVAVDLGGGQEYGLARWTISNSKTVGTDACSGCATPVCILLNTAYFTTVGNLNDTWVGTANFQGSNRVTWQGAGTTLCIPTPTKKSTWGAVKSLYR